MSVGRQPMHATKTDVINMFVDKTAGESTDHNRLITQEGDNGNVELIAYGWLKIAEYNESRNAVTVFTGHQSMNSCTVSTYLNDVAELAEERGRDLIASGESPTDGKPNAGTVFINNYINFENKSAVEKQARNKVIDSLKGLA